MKKILSLVLAMLMIISMVPAVFAADASESDYQAAIDYLKAIELYKGTGDSDAADELVERYQMALFTARMVTGRVDKAYWETEENDSGFTDLEGLNEEALGGVSYAAQQGIVNGIGGGEFAPFDNVTYRDAIVMIVRALGFNYPASGYPWSYINKARELGVLDGISGVTYTVEVKREVIAQLLYNALNAEIKGATLAETAFGVAETIVMVTATPAIAYGADAAKSIKASMVKVSAIDAEGEPIGTEYYVPYKALGLKTDAAANAVVGTTYKLTHKDNFSEFLAYESLSKVFENSAEKKQIVVADDLKTIKLGTTNYTILAAGAGYTSLTNNQGTVTGTKEIKVFKAFGATAATLGTTAEYVMAANGNIYAVANPFVPYAVYSALIDAWFTYDATTQTYTKLTDTEVADLIALTADTVEGFTNIGASAYIKTKLDKDNGAQYDYYKAIASDIDGDGDYDRVTVRPYELFRMVSKSSDGKKITIASYSAPVNGGAAAAYTTKEITVANCRFTGLALNKVAAGDFFVAYFNGGKGNEQELDIVAVSEKFSAYLRGYDATTNNVIYGSDYATISFGYMGVANTTAYVPSLCKAAAATTSATANYLRSFWNSYVDMYTLNGKVIYVQNATEADNYVIVESFTDFTEDGLKVMAYSTLANGKAEITISELNGWNLGGFDYELFTLLKQMEDLGLTVKDYPLPIKLNTVYKVQYVAEDGSYNLVAAAPYATDKDLYVNNFGYILGVDANGAFASDKRVATNDKDLWIILQGDKIHMFKGKLSTVELYDLDFYKAKGNQFVAVADATTNLGPILGNTNEGVDYWMYNLAVDKYYNQNFYGQFVYGHFMTNMRTGAIEFVTYDSALATAGFNGKLVPMTEGAIYKATNKVITEYSIDAATKEVVIPTYSMKNVAASEFATGKYFGKNFAIYTVGAALAADFNGFDHPVLAALGATKHFVSFAALRDAMAVNMYEVIYDRDFTNTDVNVDSWAAIKQELVSKITFVDRTAAGVRNATAGYNTTYGYTDMAIGSAETVVAAYVMYDYANNSATVFFDSYAPVVLTSETTADITVGGVTNEIVYASNALKNETVVTINFVSPMNVSEVVIEGEYTDLFVDYDHVTYKVASATYTGAPVITATAMTKVTGLVPYNPTHLVTNSNGDAVVNGLIGYYSSSTKPVELLYDGKYTQDGAYTSTAFSYKYSSFNYKFNADLTIGEYNASRAGTEPYWGAVLAELPEVATLKATRIVWAAHSGNNDKMLPKGLAILVSADGQTWTEVGSASDMVVAGTWKYINDGVNVPYFQAEFDLTNAPAAKYVAMVATDMMTDGSWSTRQFNNVHEIEFYK